MDSLKLKSTFLGLHITALLDTSVNVKGINLSQFSDDLREAGWHNNPATIIHHIGLMGTTWCYALKQVWNVLYRYNVVTVADEKDFLRRPYNCFVKKSLVWKTNKMYYCTPEVFIAILFRLTKLGKGSFPELNNVATELNLHLPFGAISDTIKQNIRDHKYTSSLDTVLEAFKPLMKMVNSLPPIESIPLPADSYDPLYSLDKQLEELVFEDEIDNREIIQSFTKTEVKFGDQSGAKLNLFTYKDADQDLLQPVLDSFPGYFVLEMNLCNIPVIAIPKLKLFTGDVEMADIETIETNTLYKYCSI